MSERCSPLAPTSTEIRPQLNPIDGFPKEGSERKPGMGSLSGFDQEKSETLGASFRVRGSMRGSSVEAMNPTPSPNWLGGRVLPPSVPRWEEQPTMKVDNASLAPSPASSLPTVSPTASSY